MVYFLKIFKYIFNKYIALIAVLLLTMGTSKSQVNLQFSKPITFSGTLCGGVNSHLTPTCTNHSDGDTVPVGKIWKIEFIGAGGSTALCPRFSVNGAELNGWSTSNKQLWESAQPIWLNSGDRFLFYIDNCGSYGTFYTTWVVNVLEFNKQ
jgi:hypothetical protein